MAGRVSFGLFLALLLISSVIDVSCSFSASDSLPKQTNSKPRALHLSSKDYPPPVFPASTRAALVEKAKFLDEEGLRDGYGSYSSRGWTNRLGSVLTPASIPDVYTGDRPFMWNDIDVSCRMTVIKLENGDLWIHSPVSLDAPLKKALEKLGTVKYVVSPNYEHLSFATQWANAYPDAFMWGCPGLSEKMPEISWEGEIPEGIRPLSWKRKGLTCNQVNLENCWNMKEVQPLHLNIEINPATGKPFFNEVIFYHEPSRTLITTDLFWNYPQPDGVPNSHLDDVAVKAWELAPRVESIPFLARVFFFGMNNLYLPFYKNVMVKKSRSEYETIAKFLTEELEIDTLVPAHGDLVRGQSAIRTVLRRQLL